MAARALLLACGLQYVPRNPRHPARATPRARPQHRKNTGRQSATSTLHTTSVREVTAASAAPVGSPASKSAT